MGQNNLPEGDRIYDLYTGVYKPQIIRIALALDVFSTMAAGPQKAEVIAQACKCEVIGMHHLLNYLTSLNILISDGEEYALSVDAATFLVQGGKAYAGDLIMDFVSSSPWESLQESIRSGQPRNIDLEVHFAEDAWIESYRSLRISSSLEMWSTIGIIPEEFRQLRMLDLACGCAIKSMVLVQQYPGVFLTCLDTPLVLNVARDLAERWGILSKIRFIPDNLLTADLGESQYDVCLLGQVTHYLTQKQNKELFSRIYKTLIPGGELVLDVPMSPTKFEETSSFLSLLLWANSGGRAYQYDEYHSWLVAAGFSTVRQHSARLLSANR
jgi:SAM-dependent methyltransferase